MEAFELAEKIVKEAGFTCVALLDIGTLELLDEVRDMCAANTCGKYGANWACPPGCGELEELRKQIARYQWGILVQTVGDVEDSMDFEWIIEVEKSHKKSFYEATEKLKEQFPDMLALGAGCCTLCKECTYPSQPCRFPQKRVSSMESYGILVNDLCKKNGMSYYYGSEKMAYTSCYLFV